MADLTLKVSESLYRDTISQLGEKVLQLNACLSSLQAKRQQIQSYYTGPTAAHAIQTIQKDEENVKRAIKAVVTQKQQIENYLNEMNRGDQEIDSSYKDAMSSANNVFG